MTDCEISLDNDQTKDMLFLVERYLSANDFIERIKPVEQIYCIR